jgi:thiosulfate/3-mercaptopyruvate sulfurtransferase
MASLVGMIRSGLLLDVADLETLDVVLLDTRLTTSGAPGRKRYDAGHLPGATYVDMDDDLAAPPGDGGRHPLPDPDRFVRAMQRAGVWRGSTVVVYDDGPATAAARLWWLLRDYGHEEVLVLNGGLAAWTAAGRSTSTVPIFPGPGDWTGSPGHLPTVDDGAAGVLAALDGVLIDVRSTERFRGEHEPLDPVAGHVPGAVNAPLTELTDDLGRFLPSDVLGARFRDLGVRDDTSTAVYCGSGVTACQTVLALQLAGLDAALYPASWSGWITDRSRPVATGA